jgi:hypothetical protein
MRRMYDRTQNEKELNSMDVQVIPIVGMMIPIIIVPTALAFRHARFLRQVEHDERMRAMELGQTLAEDQSWTPGSIAMSIGAGVPIASMFIAFIAAGQGGSEAIWMAAAMIGVAGVISGSVLAGMQFSKRDQSSTVTPEEKAAYDPDAFDVVGRRG